MDQSSSQTVLSPQHDPAKTLPAEKPRWWVRLFDRAVTLVAVAGLVGLMYWGHENGWQLGNLNPWAKEEAQEKDDWCEAHRVPESICIECHPEKAPISASFGWCQEHGVTNCLWEHPELAQVSPPPMITPADRERARAALAFADRAKNSDQCKLHEKRIQLASAEVAKKCGIETALVENGPIKEVLDVHGDLMYDQTRIARLSARIAGSIWSVQKQVSDPVRKGDVLALIEAAEVGRVKGEFSQALAQTELRTKNWEALRQGAATGAVPERDLREADTAAQEARIRLKSAQQALANLGLHISADDLRGLSGLALDRSVQFLGLPAELVKTLDPQTTPASLLPLLASQDGVVVMRQAVRGEMVDPTKVLFTIAAIDPLWLMLDVHFEDVERLRTGMTVTFRPDGAKTDSVGRVAWVGHEADEKTRTVKVRVDVDNHNGALVVRSFGCGQVVLRDDPSTILVPNNSIQSDGCCEIVFVKDKSSRTAEDLQIYHVRQVRIGGRNGPKTEILAGLLPGETVVTKGSGIFKGELLKSKIGAAD
jgi:cobalt-zinc-cadmium efflux system membrane fusion protein